MMYDAVILAGGTGSRLGGIDKAALDLEGQTLLTRVLDATHTAQRRVVVGRTSAHLPHGVLHVVEEPQGSGPAAAVAAGVRALAAATGTAPRVALLACDLPDAARALPRVLEACEADHGAVLLDPNGRLQWLVSAFPTALLAEEVATRQDWADRPLRAVLGDLPRDEVAAQGDEWRDIDTWDDHEFWTERWSTTR